MVKAYLRYEHSQSFGVICGNNNNSLIFDQTGKKVITAALENIIIWNIKTGQKDGQMQANLESIASPAEVTVLAKAPEVDQLAVGYSDGTIRLWQLSDQKLLVSLSGHGSGISAICYSNDSGRLFSGGNDGDIVIWDTTIGIQTALYRLRGHKTQITELVYIMSHDVLVSSSKDGYMKVWQLETQTCVQTLTGWKGEVWGMALSPCQTKVIAGGVEKALIVYQVVPLNLQTQTEMNQQQEKQILKVLTKIERSVTDRVVGMAFSGKWIMVYAAKVVELHRICATSEKATKKKKKKKDKESLLDENTSTQPDFGISSTQIIKFKSKVRSASFDETTIMKGKVVFAVALANNQIEIHSANDLDDDECLYKIDNQGHRGDIRAMSLSHSDGMVLTTSSQLAKIHNVSTGTVLSSIQFPKEASALSVMWAPGDKYAVIGTKEGYLLLIELFSQEIKQQISAHEGAVWSLVTAPGGFASGSSDKTAKFWEWVIINDGELQITEKQEAGSEISEGKTLELSEEVVCIAISADAKFIALSLQGNFTLVVHYLDTLRFFLSLYGHRLPVLCMDISDDGRYLISGGADKNVRIWNMDFGDCRKSLFAHSDQVRGVKFVKGTHYFFSVGRDKMLKYWDADECELLLELSGHFSEINCIQISQKGHFVLTAATDQSIRRWDRSEEPFFLEEEKEKRLERIFDQSDGGKTSKQELDNQNDVVIGKQTQDTMEAAEKLMDAIEFVEQEIQRIKTSKQQNQELMANPLLMGMEPEQYLLSKLQGIKTSDLEQVLIILSFSHICQLLKYLNKWSQSGQHVEAISRIVVLIISLHHGQIIAAPTMKQTLRDLQKNLLKSVGKLKDNMGMNLAALWFVRRQIKEKQGKMDSEMVKYRIQ